MSSVISMDLVNLDDYEQSAQSLLPKIYFDFFRGGACSEKTLKWNRLDFQKIRIRPLVLRNVSKRSMKCKILSTELDMPVGIAPTGMHKLAHPDGEIATAKAAGSMNTIYIMSTVSNTSVEDIAAAAPNTHKWFQLYLFNDRRQSEEIIRKVEKYNFEALVLTVDLPVAGIRYCDIRNKFNLPSNINFPNFGDISKHFKSPKTSGIEIFANSEIDSSLSWDTVEWLVNFTKLPVILKGILTVEDAVRAVKSGCKGIIISNHGARQLDTVDSSIAALPPIVRAVGDQLMIMMDGGITQGTDVFKALALGAKMVFIGRPIIWGLATNGQKGVENVLNILKHEFDITMALAGTRTLDEIRQDFVKICLNG